MTQGSKWFKCVQCISGHKDILNKNWKLFSDKTSPLIPFFIQMNVIKICLYIALKLSCGVVIVSCGLPPFSFITLEKFNMCDLRDFLKAKCDYYKWHGHLKLFPT